MRAQERSEILNIGAETKHGLRIITEPSVALCVKRYYANWPKRVGLEIGSSRHVALRRASLIGAELDAHRADT